MDDLEVLVSQNMGLGEFKFNNIFRFIFLRVLSCSLISWVDSLGDEFVASHT